MKIIAVLPAFNESKTIEITLRSLQAELKRIGLKFEIIVCDDGSTDSTLEILRELSGTLDLTILEHRLNRGLGETIRDLFEFAAKISEPEDLIVRLDADNTHDPKYIEEMVKYLESGYDVIVASRFAQGGSQTGVSKYRSLLSYFANSFMRVFFPIKLDVGSFREYSCGFRGYRADIIKKAITVYGNRFIQLGGFGFACTLEKLVKLKLIGARFIEIPFVLRYDRKEGASKMVANTTTLGYLVLVLLYHWPWGGWKTYYMKKYLQ